MAGIYKVTATLEDAVLFSITFKGKKAAIDVRDQLQKAGYEVRAEMSKELD